MAKLFEPAKSAPAGRLFALALLQTACFWGFFLALLPAAIVYLQHKVAIERFDLGSLKAIVVLLFVASGSTCIYCAWLFATQGFGTPVPFQSPSRLVVRGPYRFVRNPMAMGGITQGILVGLFLGSWPVIVYAVCGAFVWHWFARPPEERDLLARHGESFARYRDAVKCWIPRLRPYDAEP